VRACVRACVRTCYNLRMQII